VYYSFVVVKLVCRTLARSLMYIAVLSRFFVNRQYFFASFLRTCDRGTFISPLRLD
jgi:hypothetical protein